jgi:hypothetical protein
MYLGEVPGGPRRGTGENHVLHPVAAHGGGSVFAHHPAQRLQQVRLAAAVRAHDAGQTLGDDQIGRIDERLEAVQSELVEPHAPAPDFSIPLDRQSPKWRGHESI